MTLPLPSGARAAALDLAVFSSAGEPKAGTLSAADGAAMASPSMSSGVLADLVPHQPAATRTGIGASNRERQDHGWPVTSMRVLADSVAE